MLGNTLYAVAAAIIASRQAVAAPQASNSPVLPKYQPGDGGTISCPSSQGTTYNANGTNYRIACYTDAYNHDLQLSYTQSLEACMNICAKLTGCVAGVWQPGDQFNGPCYLKNDVVDTGADSRFIAFMSPEDAPTTLSAASTSSTSSTTSTSSATSTSSTTTSSTTSTSSTSTSSSSSSTSSITSTTSTNSARTRTFFTTVTASESSTSSSSSRSSSSHSSTHTSSKTTSSTASSTASAQKNSTYINCGSLNQKSNLFKLRTHVFWGPPEFDNLHVQDVAEGSPPATPLLTTSQSTAGHFYHDPTTSSAALSHGSCKFSGLVMTPSRSSEAWGNVFVSDEVGTAIMRLSEGELEWDNDRFGSWLACRGADGKVKLYWWDVESGRGVDSEKCAKVQLLAESL